MILNGMATSNKNTNHGSNDLDRHMFRSASEEFEPVLVPTRESLQQNKIKEALSANQLQFDRYGLFGRTKEIELIKQSLDRIVLENSIQGRKRSRRELVIIQGPSGTGKSALARQLIGPVQRNNGIFIAGKYDVHLRNQPLLGFSSACADLSRQIYQHFSLHDIDEIRQQLATGLSSDEKFLLAEVLPDLETLLLNPSCDDTTPSAVSRTHKRRVSSAISNNMDSFSAAVQRFFDILSNLLEEVSLSSNNHDGNNNKPLVIFLDDLQWADIASMEVIKSLLFSQVTEESIAHGDDRQQPGGMLVVGCYRSEEVGDHHILSKCLRDLAESSRDGNNFGMTQIRIGNLTQDSVEEMISEVLSKDRGDARPLAEICYQRTHGCVFFLRMFLNALVEQGHLKFDIGTFQWDWNLQIIERETSATQNLVDLIQSRLHKSPSLELLKLACCLGNRFHRRTLWLIWRQSTASISGDHNDEDDVKEFERLIMGSVKELCLIPVGNTQSNPSLGFQSKIADGLVPDETAEYRFVHDKIQEAIFQLFGDDERTALQHQVGRILFEHLLDAELELQIFVVASLLNSGKSRKNTDIAALNFRAASKAKDMAAFSSASSFVRHGILNLPEKEMWTTHFKLALQLHCLGAQVEHSLGNKEEAQHYCDCVADQENATFCDKAPVFGVRLAMLEAAGHSDQATDLCLNYLAELRCNFPRQKFVRKLKVGTYVKQTKEEFIPSIGRIKKMDFVVDPEILETVQLLETGGSYAFTIPDIDLYVMIRCRLMRLVSQHGLFDEAGIAFSSFANVLMHRSGDFEKAKEIAELSMEIQDCLPSQKFRSRTILTNHLYIFGWVQPIRSQMKYFMESYNLSLRVGKTFVVGASITWYILASLFSGAQLEIVARDIDIYVPQLQRLSQSFWLNSNLVLSQLVLNLRGLEKNTTLLCGTRADEEEIRKTAPKEFIFSILDRYKVHCLCYFGEYEAGSDLLERMGGADYLKKSFPGGTLGAEYILFGVCSFAAARRTRKRKYIRMANQFQKDVRDYVRKGAINLVHTLRLLDGEKYALSGKVDQAKASYRKAVVEAVRGGFIQNAAVASQRHGEYLIELNGLDEGAEQLREAIKYYKDWGATRLSEMLLDKHASLLESHP